MDNAKLGKQIGVVGVDSGQVLICDPCYINSEWDSDMSKADDWNTAVKAAAGKFSYEGCCYATLSSVGHGQLNYKRGHAGVGIASRTAYGDGSYPAHEVLNDKGEFRGIFIDFLPGDEEEASDGE